MITKADRANFLAITDKPQASKIAEKLNRDGHKTIYGKKYNRNIITAVMRGTTANDKTAELYIFRHYKELKDEKEEMERLKQELEAN